MLATRTLDIPRKLTPNAALNRTGPMHVVKLAGKVAVLLVLAYAFFIAYTFSAPFVPSVSPSAEGMPLVSVVAIAGVQSIILASAWGVVFALPFAVLWGRFAYLAALVCVAPVIVTIVILSLQRPARLILLALMCFSIVCLIAIVPISAQVAHRWLRRRSDNPTRV